ncbi:MULTISPECIES: FAD-dependent oxidoreductase [Leifsonia]|uniref:Pyridine nucleotide-disulfide oxidoreductase n=2 Tax=Leifsonia aquatica TaxID=144185 RepID=U2RW30_LEIAQ|nr:MULTISPECIES: FAD-dependent oxidoreductase [Leifsonia]ERK72739.1 pyridine nucleotide-disulfide oxidoreductase [Leifsonia aquatica ATCC 14665]MBB2967242.1 NADPH-dependent 2,4-dienoyl-CoA reductase/sulfur reductase-like enzyme [Leifsonia aquatica]MBO1741909.1 FAD-dependent oxidoreductase [Leifsonia sp. TF02-11]QIZ97382.1 FAD-dependent oxidoreductase [Leifsonia sp. PS1209]
MHLVAIGGSDAGISAALRARELDPATDVTVVVADEYPNFSICGIPYYFSGDVRPWQSLAHRTHADLEATGMSLRLNTLATGIDVAGQRLNVRAADGTESVIGYDELIVGTGALPSHAGITGLDQLTPADGLHVIHSMGDTFALDRDLEARDPRTAIIIGAGYVGLEMAEGFSARGIDVTVLQRGPEVLSTLDPELGSSVHEELTSHGVHVRTRTVVRSVEKDTDGLLVRADHDGQPVNLRADIVLAVVGVRPNTQLLESAGATLGAGRAVVVDEQMRTGLPHVYAAGDGVVTHHRLLGVTYLPLGTTAHKQGRVAGENAIGGDARFAGSVGTQVVKVFDLVAARTGLRDHEAHAAGFQSVTTQTTADDHKRYYPGAQPISIRITGDADNGRLLGAQLVGRLGTETAKRVDTYATALFAGLTVQQISDLDLSYTPPLGSPWDAVQAATQAWTRATIETEITV